MTKPRARIAAILLAALLWLAGGVSAQEREARFGDDKMSVELVADGAPVPGEEWLLALHFQPSAPEWHGYWSNPGDAGQGMALTLNLPEDWDAGEPLYPVPDRLVISGLMNHIYEADYAVLVPVQVPETAGVMNIAPITGFVEYLACTDRICVPQDADLFVRQGGEFGSWQAQIAPMLDSPAMFEIAGERLRIGIPLPAGAAFGEMHVFVGEQELGDGLRPQYAAIQTFIREGDLLVAEIPLARPAGALPDEAMLSQVTGILSFGEGQGVRFVAQSGDVPLEGVKPLRLGAPEVPALGWLILAALAGGLLLNIMPCVFPILSLKALALAKAGCDENSAKRDALAYTAGVVIACAALGATLLLLRSAGEQVGWAFQLQEPGVVVALFLLALALTANFLGSFEIPGFAISGDAPSQRGSFTTGLLAAFVATPCTGPFMATALGASLLLPPLEALTLFFALGLGLALPFLAVGFVPALRRRLPKPGVWMETFRRWMALPMGLTALALGWLVWRLGGSFYLIAMMICALVLLALLASLGQRQRRGQGGARLYGFAVGAIVIFAIFFIPQPDPSEGRPASAQSILAPQEFSAAALAAARTSGKPVFVWFTADWCVTCKVNERVAIEREATLSAFEDAGVVSLRGDFTRRDPEIAQFLADQGAAGVPLYLWYEPGSEARQLPQVLTPDSLVDRARR
ncbi:protein-disulfide reductase DsbD family protein [Altererythrobacter sp. MF3-039]|uniref:protein-disulfide reductase DsbD family protein n=1 Tax=Altererythrobacter sp. MF3-039 TaxID=3252901 RepID=UPI00390C9FF3